MGVDELSERVAKDCGEVKWLDQMRHRQKPWAMAKRRVVWPYRIAASMPSLGANDAPGERIHRANGPLSSRIGQEEWP